MKYVTLSLRKANEWENSAPTFDQAIRKEEFVVLLGPPGGGKTSILKKFLAENPDDTQMISVKMFLRKTEDVKEGANFLLLDGLDEFRCYSNTEKTSIIYDLADKINKLKACKVALSCRELDWFGEVDLTGLQDVLNVKPGVYYIQPPDFKQKEELAEAFGIKEIGSFFDRYDSLGFLENPMVFYMVAEIHKNNPSAVFQSKQELYLSFFSMIKETNPTHKINSTEDLEPIERLIFSGYIAAFFFFTDVEKITDEALDYIAVSRKGFSKSKLKHAINSFIFRDGRFAHRTLAEFSLANYIVKSVLRKNSVRSLARVKTFFHSKGRIPTELRGIYAWICSLSGDLRLFKDDPFYQTVYGDNSLLSIQQKKNLIVEIRELSKSNPYFYRSHIARNGFEGLYQSELDQFIIQEFKTALALDNHYCLFLGSLLAAGKDLSPHIVSFIKTVMMNPDVRSYYKRDLILALVKETDFLIEFLNEIRDGTVPDEDDGLKDQALRQLYPQEIGIDRISNYLLLYHERVGGHCWFLYKTPYEGKKELVTRIFQTCEKVSGKGLKNLPPNVGSFVSDYLLETCLKFESPDGLSSLAIYNILKHFQQFLAPYEKFRFDSYRFDVSDRFKLSKEKIKRLANELLSIYIDDLSSWNSNGFLSYDFSQFFPLEMPDKTVEILLGKMSQESHTSEENFSLFRDALANANIERRREEDFKSMAEKFNFVEELEKSINPPKHAWEIRQEERVRKEEEKRRLNLQQNEKYFANKSSEEILSSFNDLFFIASAHYIDEDFEERLPITSETKQTLSEILAKAIYQPISPEILTIDTLAKNAPAATRNIDLVYYVSVCLEKEISRERLSKGFQKYLYISSIQKHKISNVIKGNYIEQVEKLEPDLASNAIEEFLSLLYGRMFPDHADILLKYVKTLKNFEPKKKLVELYGSEEGFPDRFLESFLRIFNIRLLSADLKQLVSINCGAHNKLTIESLLLFSINSKSDFRKDHAVAIYSLIRRDDEKLDELEDEVLIRLLDFFMDQFPTEDSIRSVNGFQSEEMCCASYLRNEAFNLVSTPVLEELQSIREDKHDVWTKRIAHELSERGQKASDNAFSGYTPEEVQNFLFGDGVFSALDFFDEVYFELCDYREMVQNNRSREKQDFFDSDGKPKIENICRDVVYRYLKTKHENEWELNPEELEADNRVDINIKYRSLPEFEVQVECKRDSHSKLMTSIPEQLVKKYMKSDKVFGVYLVFNFDKGKDLEIIRKRLESTIPDDFKHRTKIIIIDLCG